MHKKLLVLAVASAMSAPVFAQSQVTLYGTFDGGIRHESNIGLGTAGGGLGQSKLTMDSNGTYNSNRWGVTGSEDMGNGMKANFTLEGGFWTGTGAGLLTTSGAGLFGRKAIVGLSGNWGKLDLGKNYTTIFYTTGAYDPFNYKYTNIIPIAGLDGARRASTITYTSNPMNGLTLRSNIGLGEVADSNTDNMNTELGVSYANGPLNLGVAYGVDNGTAPAGDSKQWTIGGGYAFGAFKIMGGVSRDDNYLSTSNFGAASGAEVERTVSWIGGRYAMSGNNALSLAYYHDKRDAAAADGSAKLWILGFVHNLSKRTEFYADIDSRKVDGTLNTGTNSSNRGISVGINHSF